MRVVILAEDAPGALGHSYASAFKALGADVRFVCLRELGAMGLPVSRIRGVRRALHRFEVEGVNRRLRACMRDRADLILVIKGELLSSATLDVLKEQTGAKLVNFYPDDPFSDVPSNRLRYGPSVLSEYDVCFTFARHLIPLYEGAGARQVEYLPFARDPALHSPDRNPDQWQFDVIFVGNLDDGRVRWLEGLPEVRLAVFGERTRSAVGASSSLRRATFFPAAYGRELSRALGRGAISINIMRPQNEGSHNMRSFESPACGAFTLSQRTPELIQLFREGEEIACFSTPRELSDQVQEWLSSCASRRRIAEAGFARVEHDTYELRARQIVTAAGLPS